MRHAGNKLAAGTGATLRELMDRMGHSTARAALIYLHGSDQRQQEIAQALSDLAEAEVRRRGKRSEKQATHKASGTRRPECVMNCPAEVAADELWPAAFVWRAWQDSNLRPAA